MLLVGAYLPRFSEGTDGGEVLWWLLGCSTDLGDRWDTSNKQRPEILRGERPSFVTIEGVDPIQMLS